ncbi:E3 ubiquitin-protein ligase TRIM9 [Clonorchis sinensis]|uniref:E3 ubiquitin-protein ligase TRIM9 n=1 Tax=Clonorchis sinensis TaxID=79923 RepID=G7YH38_CLOSI|nr:E3 ubiquitin-protein ligase TRIM9 [Clonorchis sinensis]
MGVHPAAVKTHTHTYTHTEETMAESLTSAMFISSLTSPHELSVVVWRSVLHQTEVTKHLHELSALAKEGGELVHELKSTGTRIKQSAQIMESNLNKQIDLLIQLLERRRAILLDELRSQLQHHGRRLRDQSNQVGSRLSATTSLIHFAVELLKEQDAAAFIQILPSIQKRILTAESQFELELELASQTKACGEIELRVNTDFIGQQVETLQLEEYYAPPVPAFLSSECVVDGNALFVVWQSARICPSRKDFVIQTPQETPPQARCPFADAVDSSLGGSRPSGLAGQFSSRPGLNPIKQNGHLNATHFHSNRLSPQQFPVSVSAYHLSDKTFDGPLSNGGHTSATPFSSRKTFAPCGTRQPEMNSSQSMNAIHPPSQILSKAQITTGRFSPRSPSECNPITYSLEVDNGRGGIFKVAYTGPETACRLEGLQFNTTYRLRVRARNSVGHSAYSDAIHLRTARLATFRIDPSSGLQLSHSSGLHVDSDGVTVQSLGDVEDRVLLADVGFSQGTHYWEWRIEAYDGRGQPSFGVALNSVARDRMLGLDNAGWAMYANSNRSWFVHAGQHRDRTDGGILTKDQLERDRQPTVIGVRLDCDQGHLGFYLNGEPHGPVAFTNLLQNGKQLAENVQTDLKDDVRVARTAKPALFYPALSLSHLTRVRLITGLEVPSESEESSEESDAECGVLAVHTPESTSSLSTPNNTSERSRTSLSTGKDSSSSTTSTDGGSQLRLNRPSAIHPDMTGIGLARGCTILTGTVGVTGPKSPTPIRLVTFGRS